MTTSLTEGTMSHSDDLTPAAPSPDTLFVGLTDHEPLDAPSDQTINTATLIRSLSANVNGLRLLHDDVQSRIEALEADVDSLLATQSVVESPEQRAHQLGRNHTPVEQDGGVAPEDSRHNVSDPQAQEQSSPFSPSPSPSLLCSVAEETSSAHAAQRRSTPLMAPHSSPEPTSQPWQQSNRSLSELGFEEHEELQPAAVGGALRSRPEWIVDMVRFHGENCREGSDFAICDLCQGW